MSKQVRQITFYTRRVVDRLFSPKLLLMTNTALGGGFMWAADLYSQKMEQEFFKKNEEFYVDRTRSKTLLTTGFAYGVVGHYWYKFLDWKFPASTKKKLLCELAAGPPFGLAMFMAVGHGEGKNPSDSLLDFVHNLENLLAVEWFFYLPMQFFNFNLIPGNYRFLFVAFVTLVYDVFLSFIIHKSSYQDREPYFRIFQLMKKRLQEKKRLHEEHLELMQHETDEETEKRTNIVRKPKEGIFINF